MNTHWNKFVKYVVIFALDIQLDCERIFVIEVIDIYIVYDIVYSNFVWMYEYSQSIDNLWKINISAFRGSDIRVI